ncbi:Trypsin epsilon [Smittium culicis]|uniref:Trypsin epsilon n=1 Tax=Smittium culicis TaxID=133412 RepID=A0A1R1X6G1_9FUNG|nr:Trypsin epsilon [Smittium culicis]
MVSIHRLNEECQMLCGGVLLSSSVVLTAAHCILDTDTNELYKNNEIKVRVGSKYWLGFGGKEFSALKMHIHNYKDGDDYRNDIGIIHLDQNISDEFIKSKGIKFPKIYNRGISSKTKAMVLGWGETKYEYSSRTILAVNVNISFSEICKKYVYWSGNNKHTICANPENSRICPGDSGGPLVFGQIESNNKRAKNVIIGIASFNMFEQKKPPKCGADYMTDYYANAYYYLNWISEKSNINVEDLKYFKKAKAI